MNLLNAKGPTHLTDMLWNNFNERERERQADIVYGSNSVWTTGLLEDENYEMEIFQDKKRNKRSEYDGMVGVLCNMIEVK